MKLLHTSDWHLGQTLHQHDREHEHAQFLDWLLDTLVAEQVDALLIAGDVFDNTNPSAASQRLLYRFLTQARQRLPGLDTVVIAGNHDSPGRLEAPTPFLDLLGVRVVGHVALADPDRADSTWRKLVLPLHTHSGEVGAWCVAMPFLRPADVPRVGNPTNTNTATATEPFDAYAHGQRLAYQQALAQAQRVRQPGQALVAMGHCHITGAEVSEESERRIVIGGAEALSASLFDPALAYVALGHLHLAQSVGGDGTRRYSGSPLPMSFSEINYPHQVVLVELAGEQVASTRPIRVPRTVELLRVPPQPAPLAQVLQALSALPDAPAAAPAATPDAASPADAPSPPSPPWPYLQVRVQLTQPEPALRAHIEAALAGKAVRLVRIETTVARRPTATGEQAAPPLSLDELNSLSPTTFFERLYRHRFGNPPEGELMAAFQALLNHTATEAATESPAP